MKIWEILLIVACVAVVVGVVIATVIRKIKGKSSCGCDCGSCNACPHCSAQTEKDGNNTAQK